ncbi:hypothetical protein WN51_08115 [Melipona quadrifasciata]|uniref:Uncharacterized protein n=1 Tax=Melipona quadrifasciata TaxID=166423 RepID=A0A0N0BBL3_9HYME|nr:hypothetical protein WN51_08115 [Melipona quadrifasciata]
MFQERTSARQRHSYSSNIYRPDSYFDKLSQYSSRLLVFPTDKCDMNAKELNPLNEQRVELNERQNDFAGSDSHKPTCLKHTRKISRLIERQSGSSPISRVPISHVNHQKRVTFLNDVYRTTCVELQGSDCKAQHVFGHTVYGQIADDPETVQEGVRLSEIIRISFRTDDASKTNGQKPCNKYVMYVIVSSIDKHLTYALAPTGATASPGRSSDRIESNSSEKEKRNLLRDLQKKISLKKIRDESNWELRHSLTNRRFKDGCAYMIDKTTYEEENLT